MRLLDAIQQHRDDEPLMSRIAATLGICALIFLSITLLRLSGGYVFAAPQETSSPSRVGTPTHEPAEAAIFPHEQLAELLAGCMNGHSIVWTDPHTKMEMAAKCRVVELGRMP